MKKFIAFEVSIGDLRRKYGRHFDVIMSDLKQEDDLRVFDYDGHRVFTNFELSKLGKPIYYEP